LTLLNFLLTVITDNTPPEVKFAPEPFGGSPRPVVRVGDVVSLTLIVSGTECLPVVKLFNGARAAATLSQASPFVFSYQIQEGDTGSIEYDVSVQDAAGNVAGFPATDRFRTAGNVADEEHTWGLHASV